MVNLMRNLGGSIGISAVTTLIARRTQVHQNYLAHNLYQYNPRLQALLSQMTQRFGSRSGDAHGLLQSYRAVYATVEQQATVLAYIDTFWISGFLCLCAVGLLFIARKAKPGSAAMH
jgi:DHA2 family multidrug resistance protein